MLKLIRMELKKALNYRFFLVVLFFTALLLMGLYRYQFIPEHDMFQKWNAFHGWFYSVEGGSFYLVGYMMPLIVVAAYGDSLFNELKNGYVRMSCIRVSFKKYIRAKFIVNGFIAALVAIIPSSILLLISSILYEHSIPTADPFRTFWNPHGEFMNLYLEHPFIYMLFSILIMGCFSFVYSSLAFSISFYVKHRAIVLIFPFLAYTVFQLFCDYFSMGVIEPLLSLLYYVQSGHSIRIVITEYIIITAISILPILKKTRGETII